MEDEKKLNKSGNRRGLANKGNLIVSKRDKTPEERRADARKAGIASGKARRAKSDMMEAMRAMLSMPVSDTQKNMKGALRALGVEDDDMTYSNAILAMMVVKASNGDVKAAQFVRDTAGMNAEYLLKEDQFEYEKENGKNINVNLDGEVETKSKVHIYLPEVEDSEESDE